MRTKRYVLLFLVVTAVLLYCFTASAKWGKGGFKKETDSFRPSGRDVIERSGLKPVFPEKARCIEIASPYASPTRYDGSPRPSRAPGGGLHGGIDLTLPQGTPLLALADGTVVNKGRGGMMLGTYLWLKHSPQDTVLPYWVYSKYQHLKSLPDLPVGEKVVMGQVIAHSGMTGTQGGHYGTSGYPHLHLTTRKSPDGEFKGSLLVDPLVVYYDAAKKTENASSGEKSVEIPYMTPDGKFYPEGTRVVWPVACDPK